MMIMTKLTRQLRITGTIFTTEEIREGVAMAYDNFENTPFDLNHDGHIDSNEAAYIYDTFYKEKDERKEGWFCK